RRRRTVDIATGNTPQHALPLWSDRRSGTNGSHTAKLGGRDCYGVPAHGLRGDEGRSRDRGNCARRMLVHIGDVGDLVLIHVGDVRVVHDRRGGNVHIANVGWTDVV